jgi:hypothetical protein
MPSMRGSSVLVAAVVVVMVISATIRNYDATAQGTAEDHCKCGKNR